MVGAFGLDIELEVDGGGLRQVADRVVRHYLGGDRADLVADLTRDAFVTYPPVAMRIAEVSAITWVQRPSRIAVAVTAEGPERLRLALRYELQVVRLGGRWLVRGIELDPLQREEAR